MHLDTTIRLASIRQDELRHAASHHRATTTARRPRTRWGRRTHREQGARS
jgi:hypothetical protein